MHAAPDVDRADAGDLLEALADIALHERGQLHQVAIGLHADDQYRFIVRIELADAGRVCIFRQLVAQAVEGFADVVTGLVEIGALHEAQGDRAAALAG